MQGRARYACALEGPWDLGVHPWPQVFARRQTIWDTAINLIRSSSSSDSNLLGTLVNVVCIAVVNFTGLL